MSNIRVYEVSLVLTVDLDKTEVPEKWNWIELLAPNPDTEDVEFVSCNEIDDNPVEIDDV